MDLRRQLRDPWTTVPGAVCGAAAWTGGVRPLAAGAVAVVVVAVKVAAAELGGSRPEMGRPAAEPREDVPATVNPSDTDVHVFRRDGQFWRVGSGQAVFALKDAKGLRCLHMLLGRPNEAFYCVLLAQLCEGVAVSARPQAGLPEGTVVGAEAPLPRLDERAVAEYRKEMRKLEMEFTEAKAWNDEGRVVKLESEIEALKQQILNAHRPGGGDATTGGQEERARVNVQKSIKNAIGVIATHDPSLAHHLSSTIRTGKFCRYEPDPRQPRTWQL